MTKKTDIPAPDAPGAWDAFNAKLAADHESLHAGANQAVDDSALWLAAEQKYRDGK